jgi:hypothetical protein
VWWTQLLAVSCSGVFFGAALYITVAQHPAVLEAGAAFAARFFAPMYRRAAPMQAGLAGVGAAAGVAAWGSGAGAAWLVGALLLIAVVPVTLVWIRPVNDRLLAPDFAPDATDSEALLRRWGVLHAVRTLLSGLAFLVLLAARASS